MNAAFPLCPNSASVKNHENDCFREKTLKHTYSREYYITSLRAKLIQLKYQRYILGGDQVRAKSTAANNFAGNLCKFVAAGGDIGN